jgi:hypothetical protein
MRRGATHEDFSREHIAGGPSERSFGIVFTVFFAAVALWPALDHRPIRPWALAVSGAFLLLALAAPAALRVPNRLWMRVGLLIGRITNPIVTGLMFYLVFTPGALMMRILGKDPLRLRPDARADSYWIPRQPPGPEPESMIRQF